MTSHHYGSMGYDELKDGEGDDATQSGPLLGGGLPPDAWKHPRSRASLVPRAYGMCVLLLVVGAVFLPIFTADRTRHTIIDQKAEPSERDEKYGRPVATIGDPPNEYTLRCGGLLKKRDFNPKNCGPPDFNLFCTALCDEGTACHDVCGTACENEDNSWAAFCLMSAFAHLEETCAGTFVPEPPAPTRRRMAADKDAADDDDVNWTLECGSHAICEVCDELRNPGCRVIFEQAHSELNNRSETIKEFRARIAYDIQMGVYGWPGPSVSAVANWDVLPMMLEAPYLDEACATAGFPRP